MNAKKKIRVAIIGCGNIGKRHVAVFDSEPNAEIVALCDINIDKAKNLSETYGGNIKTFRNYYDIFKIFKNIDLVSIATPHGLHAEMSIAASKNKCNVLVEKPMALNIRDCKEMIKNADINKVKLFVVKQNRYNIPIKVTKDALDEKKLGKIYMVQCNVMWNRHREYYSDSNWRGTKDLEGSALNTQVSHFIDLLIWWFGDILESKSIIKTLHHNIEIEDCGVSAIEFESGVIGSLLWTTSVYNKNYEGSITIIGENGTIKIGGKYLNKIEFWDVKSHPLPEDIVFEDKPNNYGKYQGTSSNHDKLINNVMLKLLNERKHVVEGDEGMKTIIGIENILS